MSNKNCVNCMNCRYFKLSNYCDECYNNLKDYYDKNEKVKKLKMKRKEYDRKYYLGKKLLNIKKKKEENDNFEIVKIKEGKFVLEI